MKLALFFFAAEVNYLFYFAAFQAHGEDDRTVPLLFGQARTLRIRMDFFCFQHVQEIENCNIADLTNVSAGLLSTDQILGSHVRLQELS